MSSCCPGCVPPSGCTLKTCCCCTPADDLAQSSFGFWGGSTLKLTGAKVWYPDGLPAHQAARQQALQAPGLVLQTARDMLKVAALASETLALGRDLDITSFSCDVASGETADRAATKPSKPHAHKGNAGAAGGPVPKVPMLTSPNLQPSISTFMTFTLACHLAP